MDKINIYINSKNRDLSETISNFTVRIPQNLLNNIMQCKYLKYFYSADEQAAYFNQWTRLSTTDFTSYTDDHFKMYEELSLENAHIDCIQLNHYLDEGCHCNACNLKRSEVAKKIASGSQLTIYDHIRHDEAKNQLLAKRVIRANKINTAMKSLPQSQQKRGKDFKQDMNNTVAGKTRY